MTDWEDDRTYVVETKNNELRDSIDRAIAEWLRTNFALARASWGKDAAAIDHLQYLHLSEHEVQLTPKILALLAEDQP